MLHAEGYLKSTLQARKNFEELLEEKKFNELDRAAADARNLGLTTSDGTPLLDAIYNGVAGCLCEPPRSIDYWNKKKKLLQEWQAHNPKSVTAKTANSRYYSEYAWSVRGGGYASDITDMQWGIFKKNIEKARTELLSMRSIGESDPGWYAALLFVGMSQGWEAADFEKVYADATSKFPSYIPLYRAAGQYHSARWHGSNAEFRSYVERAVQQTKETMGDTMYARLNWQLASNDMFKSGETEWKPMRRGFERIMRDFPDQWNTNAFAMFSCLAGDAKILPVVMKRIKEPILSVWWSKKLYDQCKAFSDDVHPAWYDEPSF
jgi:hypothetical protein